MAGSWRRRPDLIRELQTLRLMIVDRLTNLDARLGADRLVAARLHLVNQQIKEAHRALDGLCARLEAAMENPSGQIREQHDMTILRSWPGIGRIVLATLLR